MIVDQANGVTLEQVGATTWRVRVAADGGSDGKVREIVLSWVNPGQEREARAVFAALCKASSCRIE